VPELGHDFGRRPAERVEDTGVGSPQRVRRDPLRERRLAEAASSLPMPTILSKAGRQNQRPAFRAGSDLAGT
jgi:hypothetical protein